MAKVCKRIIYKLEIRFLSPMSVSGGDGDRTDADVLRDYDGNPFISGATLAGAFRDYLSLKRSEDGLMGYAAVGMRSKKNEKVKESGAMSRLIVSDLKIQSDYQVVVRDGVGLDENKNTITGAKYDMEAIDTGAMGTAYFELVIRENDDVTLFENQVRLIFSGIQHGDIRVGRKKTRGYGKMKIINLYRKVFDAQNYCEYGQAYSSGLKDGETIDIDGFLSIPSDKYVRMIVPLKNTGCISIRQYHAKKGEPDFVHIHANGNPVIPGTSFAGAIRSRTFSILKNALGVESTSFVDDTLNEIFGYVKKQDALRSRIVFMESEIRGGKELAITRTAISRFLSSARTGALYQETTCVEGTVDLEIWIEKKIATKAIPLIMPAILDLQRGYLAVGGMVSIGRGILKKNGEIRIEGWDEDLYQVRNTGTTSIATVENYFIDGGERV